MLTRYLYCRSIAGNSSVSRLTPALDLSFMLTKLKNYSTDEYSTMDSDGMSVPPLACSFAKMAQHQHIIGMVDEDGYFVLYDTNKTGRAAVIKTWQVHANAVFDLEWLQQESKILTGSGDQTIALYDIETCQKLETFKGHASSVKSISCRVMDDAVFVSGSRDGHIMMWDKRIFHKDGAIQPTGAIYNAHMLQSPVITSGKARKKRPTCMVKDAQQSVTSVLFQNENYIISAGAVDGCLKVWDIRKTYRVKGNGPPPVYVFQYPGLNSRKHGYSSLVQDSLGLRLFANCTDDVIYEYDMAAYNPEPIQTWQGHKNSTFYVKAALSPDDQFLCSGSSDGCAYIWQISRPKVSPILLSGHTAEVTSVAWCPSDFTKVVTLSDDTKMKFWRVYCRELKKQSLPHWLGQAQKVSKERATSTVLEGPVVSAAISASVPLSNSIPMLPNKPKVTRTTSSPALTPQGCIKTWLKRKVDNSGKEATLNKMKCISSLSERSEGELIAAKSVNVNQHVDATRNPNGSDCKDTICATSDERLFENATSIKNFKFSSFKANSATSNSSPMLPNKPKVTTTTSSPALTPQESIKTWLKRKVDNSDQEATLKMKCTSSLSERSEGEAIAIAAKSLDVNNADRNPNGGDCKDTICAKRNEGLFESATSIKNFKFSSSKANSAAISSTKSEESSSCATSPESSSQSRKCSHDESGENSSTDSPLFQVTPCKKCIKEDVELPSKKLKPEEHAQKEKGMKQKLSEEDPIQAQSPNKTSSLLLDAVEKKPIQDTENVSPRKLMKRKLTTDSSASLSPKRSCLTAIESHGNTADLCKVRMCLFGATSSPNCKQAPESSKDQVSKQVGLNELTVKSDLYSKFEFSQSFGSPGATSCKTVSHNSESTTTPSKDYQTNKGTEDIDSDSPTRNLPNLVVDQILGRNLRTPPQTKRRTQCDWLTQIILERKKKHSEAILKPATPGKSSPKVSKRSKKIKS